MWAICDIAIHLVYTKSGAYDSRDFSLEARIPTMYFQQQAEDFKNTRIYLPTNFYSKQKVLVVSGRKCRGLFGRCEGLLNWNN